MHISEVVMTNSNTGRIVDARHVIPNTLTKISRSIATAIMFLLHAPIFMYEEYSKGNVFAFLQAHDTRAIYGTIRQLFHIEKLILKLIEIQCLDTIAEEDLSTRHGLTHPTEMDPHTWAIAI